MASLLSLQKDFKASMLGTEPHENLLSAIVSDGRLSPQQRLQVHANNYREGLTDAILAIFPVMQAFVGEVFMRGLIGEYILESPPQSSCLNEYGLGLSGFIKGYDAISHLAYLTDLARLEWSVYEMQNSADFEPDDNVEDIAPEQYEFNPSVRVIESDHPVLSLWMVGTGQLPAEAVHAEGKGQTAVVIKTDYEVRIFSLEGDLRQAYGAALKTKSLKGVDHNILIQLTEFGLINVAYKEITS